MVYNVPKRTGVHLSWETTVRLAELPNVFATKEASGDLESITRIVSGTPDDFLVYSGDDSLTLPILSVGGYGVVSVVSHVVGREMKTMIEAFASGNVAEAARIHGRLMPIFSGLFSAPSPAPVKYALSLHGLDVGGLRPPLLPLNEKEQAFIRSLFSAS